MILHGFGFWPWGEKLYRVGQTFCPLGGNFYGQSYRVTWGCLTLEHFLHERHFWVGTQIWHIGLLDLRARHFTIWNDTEKISMAPCARMTRITWVDTPIWGSFFCMYLFYFFVVCYSRLSSSGGSLLAVVVVVVTSSGGGSGVWYVKSFSGPSSTFSA